MKKKINISILQFIMLTLALTGCQLQKQEITSQDKVEPVEIMHIGKDNYNYDIERFTKQFMGMSLNDAEKYDIRNLNGSYQFQKMGWN